MSDIIATVCARLASELVPLIGREVVEADLSRVDAAAVYRELASQLHRCATILELEDARIIRTLQRRDCRRRARLTHTTKGGTTP